MQPQAPRESHLQAVIGSTQDDKWTRRIVQQSRTLPGFPDQVSSSRREPAVMVAGSIAQQNSIGNPTITPGFSTFSPDLFQTPQGYQENLERFGVMTNANTGQTFELWQNALPPPTTNKYTVDPKTIKRPHVQLIRCNGGLDPSRPLLQKTEVCNIMPGIDGGPNVWGPQLYAGKTRALAEQYYKRDLFMNRNGDHPTDIGFSREVPAGFVGYNFMPRFAPTMPATQVLDENDWAGPADPQFAKGEYVTSRVEVNKPDTAMFAYNMIPEGFAGNLGGMTMPEIYVPETKRGHQQDQYVAAASSQQSGAYTVQDTQVRDGHKALMTQSYNPMAASSQSTGGYTVQDTQVREGYKALMANPFNPLAASSQQTGAYTVGDTQVREGLKALMTKQYNPLAASSQSSGAYAVLDTQVRDGLKALMTSSFNPLAASSQQTGAYAVQDTQVREGLKALMTKQFNPLAASSQSTGAYAVVDTQVRDGMKALMASQYPVAGPNAAQFEGEALKFQGQLTHGMRTYYSDKGMVANAFSNVGDSTGGGLVQVSNHRGCDGTFYTVPTGYESNALPIGASQRNTPTQYGVGYESMSNYNQDSLTFSVPRLIPDVRPSCRSGGDDIDTGTQSVFTRPNYFGEQ